MCACVCCEEGKRYESLNEYMNNLLHVCTFDKRVFGEKLAVFFCSVFNLHPKKLLPVDERRLQREPETLGTMLRLKQ